MKRVVVVMSLVGTMVGMLEASQEAPRCSSKIFDPDRKLVGVINSDIVYRPDGQKLGTFRSDILYFSNGKKAGSFGSDTIFSATGQKVAIFRNETIYDLKQQVLVRVDGNCSPALAALVFLRSSTPLDPAVITGTSWSVNNHPVYWVFSSNGAVEAAGLWKGSWISAGKEDTVTVTLTMKDGAKDEFEVVFAGDGRSFTAYKDGQIYRRGIRK